MGVGGGGKGRKIVRKCKRGKGRDGKLKGEIKTYLETAKLRYSQGQIQYTYTTVKVTADTDNILFRVFECLLEFTKFM